MLIVGTTLVHQLAPLGALALAIGAAAFASGVSVRRLARVWLGVPLFSLVVILPAALNLMTEGPALLTLWRLGPGAKLGPWMLPQAITITRPGVVIAARFVLRTVDCATLAFLLVATTEQDVLVNALRRLGMPRGLGMVLAMTQRYLTVLLRAAEQIHLAKLSRGMGDGSLRQEQHWLAAGIGSLFRRTRHLAEEVDEAMLSRGYDGDLQVGAVARLRLLDVMWLAGAAACVGLLILADRLL